MLSGRRFRRLEALGLFHPRPSPLRKYRERGSLLIGVAGGDGAGARAVGRVAGAGGECPRGADRRICRERSRRFVRRPEARAPGPPRAHRRRAPGAARGHRMASDPRDGFETHRAAFRDIALPRRRLDYVVRASAGKPALAPVYYVKLHLARPDADSAPEPVHPKVRVKVVFQRSARVASESSPRDAGHAHAHRRADARLPPHGPRRQPPGQAPRRLNRACRILLSKEKCH